MPIGRPKKMINLYILDILKRYSDIEHPMTQRAIQEKLENDYDIKVDRKAIKANLTDLIIDGNYGVEYLKEDIRMTPDKNGDMMETTIYSDFYYESSFTNSELHWLIDSVLFSKHIPANNKKRIIKNLQSQTNHYFKFGVGNINFETTNDREISSNLFLNIELIDEAINNDFQISFGYNEYGTDLKLHLKKYPNKAKEIIRKYVVSPYAMAINSGNYYLICYCHNEEKIIHFRVDKLSSIIILKDARQDIKSICGLENFDIQRYMAEHIYMSTGETIKVSFRLPRYLIQDVLDYFQADVLFEESERDLVAHVKVNETDFRYWSRRYIGQIRILSPESLIRKERVYLKDVLKLYE